MHQGTVEQGAGLFGEHEGLDSIADADGDLFALFAIERGGLREMFGLRAWARGLQALSKGHFIGRKVGDPWTLPTVVAIDDGTIVGEYRGRHAGDHPDVASLAELFERPS